MIIPAIIIHILGRLIPSWISNDRLKALKDQFSWKVEFFKMSGTVTSLLIAFVIITITTLTGRQKYLLNENAIYGINCSPLAREIGFLDGDKVLAVNNQKIERFSDILEKIMLETGLVNVQIKRDTNDTTIIVTDSDKLKIIQSKTSAHFLPRLHPGSTIDIKPEPLIYSEHKNGLKEVFSIYKNSLRMVFKLVTPIPSKYDDIMGYVAIKRVTSIKGLFFLLANNLILLGLINLIPIPGLEVGNTIIGIIEVQKKKRLNKRILLIIKIVCITLIIILAIFSTF
jgi:membrane-associated protease RseP (regulator of RpoE activity)